MSTALTTAVSDAISDAGDAIQGLITTNLPAVVGVTVAFVGLGFVRRLIRSLGH